jgi:transposase InsO family protein
MIECREPFHAHAFEYACALAGIDHRLTKPKHPWANGQVERMNRTIKEATVRRFYYETHDQLRGHLRILSQPTTSPRGSRPSKASPPTSSSAKLDERAGLLHAQSAPTIAETKHLIRLWLKKQF